MEQIGFDGLSSRIVLQPHGFEYFKRISIPSLIFKFAIKYHKDYITFQNIENESLYLQRTANRINSNITWLQITYDLYFEQQVPTKLDLDGNLNPKLLYTNITYANPRLQSTSFYNLNILISILTAEDCPTRFSDVAGKLTPKERSRL